jgi:hypothetical protein
VTGRKSRRVAPFGHLGINACVPLPQAYRSLPRPSSPPCAQASPTCLHSLDYNNLFTKQSAYKLSRPQPAFQRSGLTCTARNAPCPSLSSVNQIIHRWTKCRHSIRILKSAIYHYFRCQKASTPTTGRSPKRTATYGVKAEIEFGMRMCKTKRLQEIFQYHLTCWGTYSDPLRR